MENENPLEERFRAEVTVNGQPLRESTGYGRYWRSEDGCCDEDADRVLEHYELERTAAGPSGGCAARGMAEN